MKKYIFSFIILGTALINLVSSPVLAATSAVSSVTVDGAAASSQPSSTLAPQSTNTTGNPVCNASKPSKAPLLLPAEGGTNSVTLTWAKAGDPVTKYLVAYGTTSTTMQYGNPYVGDSNTTSTTIRELSSGTTYYFKVMGINDCMPGDFSNIVSMAPSGGVIIPPSSSPSPGFVPVSELPQYLFDISLSLENALLTKASDLVALVQFTNFGNAPTPVSLVYNVMDESGNQVFTDSSQVTVEIDELIRKGFPTLVLQDGKYSLILSTTYGDNVKDTFRQDFTILQPVAESSSLGWMLWIALILALIALLLYLYYRRRHHKSDQI